MRKKRVAINGFGRIGRAFFKLAEADESFEVAAINDLGDLENLAYLLKYDSAYGISDLNIDTKDGALVVDGRKITFMSERDPLNLPWGKMEIDLVLESTGVFTSYEKSRVHLETGAKRVVISAPVKDEPPAGVAGATVLIGVNEEKLRVCDISSNASCTTNASSPVIQILDEVVGIEKALLNTVHGYTASQSLVDGPNKKDFRKGRAAAENIIPSTTGAAIAVTKAIPSLEGKFDGIAMRVPIITGSLVDITFVAKREVTTEEINGALARAAGDDQWKRVFSVTKEPIVSSDIVGSPFASIADLSFTRVVGGNLVKVLAWYDNEAGYTHALLEHVKRSLRHIS
ncbi:MAG: type I glyceraldehyde-3-phosphate dehydrogenase [Candidatus Pacebacteria bacterium]|nr:type I glyceraldehyde-3-phosphate dehydrogenase [Candidatus Paceibacterota bacterium]